MKALKAALWDTAGTIGAALLPAITPLVGKVVSIAVAFGKWAEANKPLLVMIAKLVAIAGAVGLVLVAVGGAGTVLSGILGGLAAIVPVVGAVLGALATAFGFLVSPIGLVVAALAGLAAWWAYTSGAAGQAADWIMGKLGALMAFARDVFGGIADAMAAGDMQLAAEVMWAAIRLAWSTGIEWIRTQWADLRYFLTLVWSEAAFGILDTLNGLWSGMVDGFWAVTDKIVDAWKSAQKIIAQGIGWILAKLYRIDPAQVMATLEEDYARAQAGRETGRAERDAANQAAAEQRRAAIEAAKQDWQTQAVAKRDARIAGAAGDLEDARKRYAEARDAASKAKAAKEAAATSSAAPMPAPPPGPGGAAGPRGFASSSTFGSVEAYRALVGRENPSLAVQKRMEQRLAAIQKNTAKQSTAALKEAVPPKR